MLSTTDCACDVTAKKLLCEEVIVKAPPELSLAVTTAPVALAAKSL